MKNMRKIFALLITFAMVLGMSMMAFAADDDEPVKGTIIVQNATKGHTYTAYKVFDATYADDAISYTTPAENADLLDDTLFGWSTADANGNISVWALEDADESDIIDWLKTNYSAFGGTAIVGAFDAANSTVTFSDLDVGYYYITSSLGSAVTITTAAPAAEVYDKNFVEPTGPVKTIIAIDGEEQDEVTSANAHVGSVVTFQVAAKAVNWTGSKTADGSVETVDEATITTEWSFTDKPTNMFIDPETIAVTVNGETVENWTAAGTGDGGMMLTLPMTDSDGNSIYEAPADGLIPIVVTYDAVITRDAGTSPAKNEIPGEIPPPPVIIYTYGFQLVKVDDNEEPLPGAQFELWADGAALTFVDNGDGTYTYSPTGDDTVTTLDMTTNTTISLLGLDKEWEYTLKEITVPAGYNKLADKVVEVELTQIGEYVLDDQGNIISYTETDTSINSEELNQEVVVNNKGVELPSTGGIGTTVFYILGAVLLLGAGVVLAARRRMNVQ